MPGHASIAITVSPPPPSQTQSECSKGGSCQTHDVPPASVAGFVAGFVLIGMLKLIMIKAVIKRCVLVLRLLLAEQGWRALSSCCQSRSDVIRRCRPCHSRHLAVLRTQAEAAGRRGRHTFLTGFLLLADAGWVSAKLHLAWTTAASETGCPDLCLAKFQTCKAPPSVVSYCCIFGCRHASASSPC